jgi:hypothetical protein
VAKDVGRDGIDFGLHVANARGAMQTEFGRSADHDSPEFGANALEINALGNGVSLRSKAKEREIPRQKHASELQGFGVFPEAGKPALLFQKSFLAGRIRFEIAADTV